MVDRILLPRGTADILPDEAPLWQAIEKKARQLLQVYNYKEIRTPVFEETLLFKRSLGQTSDVVNKQLLELASHNEESGYALRPEGTASVVRSYIENSFDKKESISKFFYIGPMFRGERPQKGRLRQFHQIGVEVIGPGTLTPLLDAEVINLSVELSKAFGLNDYKLKINSLGTLKDKEHFSLFLRKQLKEHLHSLCEECQTRFERNVFRILDCKNETCRKIIAKIDLSGSHLSKESQEYFSKVKEALNVLKVPFHVEPQLVRGLDYYTHTVFEITSSGLGSQDAVGAGGRYNHLVKELGGEPYADVGAVGFSLGIERALLACPKKEIPDESLDVFILALEDSFQTKAFSLLNEIRHLGLSAEMGYSGGSIKSQMRQANRLKAKYVMILGEDEIKNDEVAIKNMDNSQQEKVAFSKVKDFLMQIRS